MENRFLEVINNEDVTVDLCENIWRIRIPNAILDTDENTALNERWNMPQGCNRVEVRRKVQENLMKINTKI